MAEPPNVSPESLDEALDVFFGNGSDAEIQAWFHALSDARSYQRGYLLVC